MVKTEGRKVWIEGAVEIFHRHFGNQKAGQGTPWAERSDTYMYLAQMRIAGWDVDYADLITVAGYSPSFAYAPKPKDKWGAHYFPIAGRDDRIAHATGFQCRWRQYKDVEAYWQALKRAIDAGKAVHAPNEEDVLFIGYEDAEKPEDRKVMPVAIVFVDENEWGWDRFVKWHSRKMVNGWFGALEKRVAPWPARASAVEVMELMVRVAEGDDSRRKPDDGVVWGIDGIDAYAADLADLSKSGAAEDEDGYFQGGWRGCHNIMPQMSGRPAVAVYLKKVAPLFEGDARGHIEAAAVAYEKATDAWRAYDRQLGRALKDVPHDDAWQNEAHRAAGAKAVREAAGHERDAIAALKQALATMSVAIPDITLEVQGKPDVHDSFIACLCAVLDSWGREADYTRVAGLSGIAFSPVLDTGEDCRAWWTEGGDDIRLDFLGRALGFTVEAVKVEEGVDDWEAHPGFDDLPEPRVRYLRRLRSALSQGKAVIVRTWPSWSVLTGWSEDLTQVPFETMPGFKGLVSKIGGPGKTGLAYVFSAAEPSLSGKEAVRGALVFGREIADGTFENGRFHYSGALYKAAAERLDHNPFCKPCGDRSWSCAIRTLQRIAGTSGSAAGFLEQAGLGEAAKQYRAIETAALGYKGKQLKANWDDSAFRAKLKQNFLDLHERHRQAAATLAGLRD